MNHKLSARPSPGFTLIELLVVIVIISISFGAMLMTVSFGSPDDDIKEELQRLKQLTAFAHQQAIIEGREYGVFFTNQGYQFLQLDPLKGLWLPLDKDKILRPRLLPSPLQLELFIDSTDIELDDEISVPKEDETSQPLLPHVFLFSSGESYPAFSLQIRIPGEDSKLSLEGNQLGQFTIHNEDDE